MHDDVHLTEGRVSRVLKERLWPAVHTTAAPVSVEWHELPGEPIAPAEGLTLAYEKVEVGTDWGPAWGTTWFRITGTVPAEWAGRRVELVCDLGFDVNMPGFQCEGLVYTPDGEPVKSLNPRNQWVLVASEAVGGEEVELFLEAAANPVLLDYHPFLPTQEGDIQTSSPKKLYTTRRIELAVFEKDVFELCLDWRRSTSCRSSCPRGRASSASCRPSTTPSTGSTCSASRRRRLRPARLSLGSSRRPRTTPPTRSPRSATPTSTPPGCGRCARRSARSPAPPPR